MDAIRWIIVRTCTSVRAQLQLIAVHKNMFINSMMRNKIPNVIHSQRSHDGRIPPSSHAGDITVDRKSIHKFIHARDFHFANKNYSKKKQKLNYMERQLDLKQIRS